MLDPTNLTSRPVILAITGHTIMMTADGCKIPLFAGDIKSLLVFSTLLRLWSDLMSPAKRGIAKLGAAGPAAVDLGVFK
jgi:hypothetical protein